MISYDMIKTDDIRSYFYTELRQENFITDKNGGKLIEMLGACAFDSVYIVNQHQLVDAD